MCKVFLLFLSLASVPYAFAVSVKGPLSPDQQSHLSHWQNPFPERTFSISSPTEESSSQQIWARVVFDPGITEMEKEQLTKIIRRMNKEAGLMR